MGYITVKELKYVQPECPVDLIELFFKGNTILQLDITHTKFQAAAANLTNYFNRYEEGREFHEPKIYLHFSFLLKKTLK